MLKPAILGRIVKLDEVNSLAFTVFASQNHDDLAHLVHERVFLLKFWEQRGKAHPGNHNCLELGPGIKQILHFLPFALVTADSESLYTA